MKKRPLAFIGFTLYISIFLLCLFEQYVPRIIFYTFAITMVLLGLLIYLFLIGNNNKNTVIILLVVFCTSLLLVSTSEFRYDALTNICAENVTIKGIIVSNEQNTNGAYYYKLKIYEYEGQNIDVRIRYRSNEKLAVKPYDEVEILAKKIYKLENNDIISDLQRRSNSENLGTYGDVINITQTNSKHPMTYILKLRVYIQDTINSVLTKNEAAFLIGILIGDTSQIETTILNDAKIAGITHIFSVSGLHVSLWSLFIIESLKKLKLNKAIRAIAASSCVLLILALSGFESSACRSAIMMLILLLGEAFSRDADSINSMGLAAIILLLVNPYYTHSPSFNLSFFATLGILTFSKTIKQKLDETQAKFIRNSFLSRPLRRLNSSLSISFSVMLFTLPFMSFYFGSFSLIAPLSNLLTILPSSFAMIFTGIAMLFSKIELLFYPLILSAGLLAKYIMFICRFLSSIPAAILPVNPYTALLSAAFALIFAYIISKTKNNANQKYFFKTAYLLFAFIFIFSNLTIYIIPTNNAKIIACDTGNGSAIIVQQNNQTALLGCGGKSGCDYDISYTLRSLNVFKLDYLLVPREKETENRAQSTIIKDFQPKTIDTPKLDGEIENNKLQYSFGRNININYSYSPSFSAALLDINGVHVLICFLPSSDFSQMPDEWRAASVLITRAAIPESLDISNFSCIIVNTDNAQRVYYSSLDNNSNLIALENISIRINSKAKVTLNANIR